MVQNLPIIQLINPINIDSGSKQTQIPIYEINSKKESHVIIALQLDPQDNFRLSTISSFTNYIETFISSLIAAEIIDKTDNSNTVLMFPEYSGFWPGMFLNENKKIIRSSKMDSDLLKQMVSHHKSSLITNIIGNKVNSLQEVIKVKESSFLEIQKIFQNIARKYRINIIGGSTISQPIISDGNNRLNISQSEEVYNQVLIFGPDGKLKSSIYKVYPVVSELGIVNPALKTQPRLTEISKGKYLAHFICADGFYPDLIQQVAQEAKQRNISLENIILTAGSFETESWDKPWPKNHGLSQEMLPFWQKEAESVNLSQRDVWESYGLPSQAYNKGFRYALVSMLFGNFWGIKGYGQSFALKKNTIYEIPQKEAIFVYRF
jgi:hypothetical protein